MIVPDSPSRAGPATRRTFIRGTSRVLAGTALAALAALSACTAGSASHPRAIATATDTATTSSLLLHPWAKLGPGRVTAAVATAERLAVLSVGRDRAGTLTLLPTAGFGQTVTVPAGSEPRDVAAAGPTAVVAVGHGDGTGALVDADSVVFFDARTGHRTSTVRVPSPTAVVTDGELTWVLSEPDSGVDSLLQLKAGRIVRTVRLAAPAASGPVGGRGPLALAAGELLLVVAPSPEALSLARFSARTGSSQGAVVPLGINGAALLSATGLQSVVVAQNADSGGVVAVSSRVTRLGDDRDVGSLAVTSSDIFTIGAPDPATSPVLRRGGAQTLVQAQVALPTPTDPAVVVTNGTQVWVITTGSIDSVTG